MAIRDTSDRAFPAALDDLLSELEWSNRHLAKLTKERFGWGSHGTINFLLNGQLAPSRKAMEVIAASAGVAPTYFAEYRLLRARDQLDPDQVGLETAPRNLAEHPHLGR